MTRILPRMDTQAQADSVAIGQLETFLEKHYPKSRKVNETTTVWAIRLLLDQGQRLRYARERLEEIVERMP